MPSRKIKVMIVEDSPTARQLLHHVLAADPSLEVVGAARSAAEAMDMLLRTGPDVVTMDVHMPGVDGLALTRKIMESHPLPVVIVSASWRPGEVSKTFRAMEVGAVAVAPKPYGPGHPQFEADVEKLRQTVRLMSEIKVVRRWPRSQPNAAGESAPPPAVHRHGIRVVAIGASTGGPPGLRTVLAGLTRDFPVPVLIVQHIAEGFLAGLAEWLEQVTRVPTHVATHGSLPLPGHAYLAPERMHMGLGRGTRIELSGAPPENGLRPSVAHLFASVAEQLGPRAAAVLLSGMGADGVREMKTLRDLGALTIAQDRETSTVFGMPGKAVEIGAAKYVLPPSRMVCVLKQAVAAG